jgi:hypothetical protein
MRLFNQERVERIGRRRYALWRKQTAAEFEQGERRRRNAMAFN